MNNLPSGTVTFLFTDIEGSTKLAQQYPDQWESLRDRHHAILQAAMDAHNGYVFQIIGDAFCVAFHTASDAVSAARKSQIDLYTENWGDVPIKVRMGIHTGQAQLQPEGDYHGYLAMSRVQRLMSAAHGGQVLLSLAAQELVRDDLPENVSLRDLGERRLKDLIRPEHIYQLVIANLPVDFPPTKTLDIYRHNLPTQLTSFIGREEEMTEIKQAILDHRLVTLTGVGGTGKTRLALQVAADVLDQFSDGVWFVELAPITNTDLIPQTILSAFGVVDQPGLTPLQLLLDYAREKTLLLVLDNCEHLIEASATLADKLLNHALSLKILATSREALGVKGEMSWPVPSLSLPDLKHLPPVEGLSQYEAVSLFIDRAILAQPHFTVTKDNAPAIAQICSRLDGIPLAIELAAARVKALSADQIAKRLDDRFRLLTGGSRTALERHQTLRAALDWSYNLLSAEEKVLLCRLSVFNGGWTLEAAEQVCNQEGGGFDVLDLLTQLVEKSLVNANESGSDRRYSILETTRQYAREKLFDSNEGELLHQKHADYFLAFAEQVDKEIHGPRQLEWTDTVETEFDNFRIAFEWSISAGHTEKAAQFFNSLNWAWHLRDHFSEMSEWFEKVIALPDIEHFPLQQARLLTKAGSWEWLQGRFIEARSHLVQAQAICLELGAEGEADYAWALTWLGLITYMESVSLTEAASLAEEASQLHQKWGDQTGEAFSTMNLGMIQRALHFPSAKRTLEHSLELYTQLQDSWGIARVSQQLGNLSLQDEDFEKAQKYMEQHLFLDEKLDFRSGISAGLDNLADLHRAQGKFTEAEEYYQKAIQLAIDLGMSYSYSLGGLSMVALGQRDYQLARKRFTELFHRSREETKTISACDFLMGLAAVSAGLDQPERAAKLYGATLAILDTIDYNYPGNDRNEFERYIQLAREQLAEKFESLVNEGRAMTMEQAIAFALEENHE
jgi:predicted ATPase/class 3 adenylate cyclase